VLGEEALGQIRDSVNAGRPIGTEAFKDDLERKFARRVRPGKPGRPPKWFI
jgi:hypothetical protein